MPRALRELLTMLDRRIGRGEGWGLDDPKRGKWQTLPLMPDRLARQAARREHKRPGLSTRSFWRAIAEGERLGLLAVRRRRGCAPDVRPAWYGADDALDVWRRAAGMADQWQTFGRPLAHPLAHLETPEPAATLEPEPDFEPDGNARRLTSYGLTDSTAKTVGKAPALSTGSTAEDTKPEPEETQEPVRLNLIADAGERTRAERHLARMPEWRPLLLRALIDAEAQDVDESDVVRVFCECVNLATSPLGGISSPTAFLRHRMREELGLLPATLPDDDEEEGAEAPAYTPPPLQRPATKLVPTPEDLERLREERERTRAGFEKLRALLKRPPEHDCPPLWSAQTARVARPEREELAGCAS